MTDRQTFPRVLALLLFLFLLAVPPASGGSGSAGDTAGGSFPADAAPATVTVRPVETSDVLYNPGMGFADFHFGWGHPPPPNQYPPQTVAYFRWTWDVLEPSEGQYNFGLVDNVIRQAKAKGETLAFRIMTVYKGSTPKWVLDKGVDSVAVGGDIFPDHNHPVFLDYHERLVKAFGNRYAGKPEIDHVDIGSVGCWGEWNTACCGEAQVLCNRFFPTAANRLLITDWYFRYFPGTPLVMLQGGPIEYAASKGAGWRGDCFGDYGTFSPTWNHMVNVYEPTVRNPVVGNAWKTAPVQFEVCGVMQDWYDRGFDIDRILQKGLDWHVTVLNAKSSPVPAAWRSKVDAFLKRVGYRFVLRELTHTAEAHPGGSLTREIPVGKQGRGAHLPPLAARVPTPVERRSRGRNLEKHGQPHELAARDPRGRRSHGDPCGRSGRDVCPGRGHPDRGRNLRARGARHRRQTPGQVVSRLGSDDQKRKTGSVNGYLRFFWIRRIHPVTAARGKIRTDWRNSLNSRPGTTTRFPFIRPAYPDLATVSASRVHAPRSPKPPGSRSAGSRGPG